MVMTVHFINISKEMIGIGRLMHPTEIGGPIIEMLQEKLEAIRYRITTQFWVLTGTSMNAICHASPLHQLSSDNLMELTPTKLSCK